MKIKVMTFNTQHCLGYVSREIDFNLMAEAIKSCAPDVVGLNEMRGEGSHEEYTAQVERLRELTGMKYCYFAKAIEFSRGPYGNGLLSNIPILKAESVPVPDPSPRGYDGYYETRCVLRAELEGGITVLVSHFGLNPDEAENAVKTVLAELPAEKGIFMGDLNLQPEDPLLAPLRARLQDTADAMTEEKLSFPSDVPDRKIDYIFATPDWQVTAADIPEIVASDHRPHTATVEL